MRKGLQVPPTLAEFYKNPVGKGNTSGNISAAKYMFEKRYEILTKQLDKKIPTFIYQENELSYYFHIVIPSDMRDYDYDVVVHLYTYGEDASASLANWYCAFFSNCPSFVFTYAYVYNMDGMIIPFLADKIGKKALSTQPDDKNPDLQSGWDKSIYYAIHTIMKNIRYRQRFAVRKSAMPFDPRVIFQSVRSFDEVMKDLTTKKKDRLGVRKKLHTPMTVRRINQAKNAIMKRVKSVTEKKVEKKSSEQNLVKHHYDSKGRVVGKPKIHGTHRKK